MAGTATEPVVLGIALVVDDLNKGQRLVFRYPSSPAEASNDFNKFHPKFLAKLFRPKAALCDKSFEITIDDITFFSFPVSIPDSPDKRRRDINFFNVILGLRNHYTTAAESEDLTDQERVSLYSKVCERLSQALRHEEERCGYLSTEVTTMLNAHEELTLSELGRGSTAGRTGDTTAETAVVDPNALVQIILERSQLARELKAVWHGCNEGGVVHLLINNWLHLSLSVSTSVSHRLPQLPIRPYQSLLLRLPREDVLAELPDDASPQLRTLIRCCNPMRSFSELSLISDISVAHIFRLAGHLQHWGLARVIDTVSLSNIYEIRRDADLFVDSSLALDFAVKFEPNRLHSFLARFSGAESLGTVLERLRGQLVDAVMQGMLTAPPDHTAVDHSFMRCVIWLLRNNLLEQLHIYPYLVLPSGNPRYRAEGLSSSSSSALNPNDPDRVNDQEAYLKELARSKKMFIRFECVRRFLNGKYHFEEISWRTGIDKETLMLLLDRFSDVLISCTHRKQSIIEPEFEDDKA